MSDLTGKSAPEFSLPDLAGRVHTLGDYRDRWLLLVFHRHLG
ncbi:MAG: redoxin domain-containing protein [Akkermansiaceae bacterium]|nr:redoxin domain-containing protein [Akkermansiaceae bacterium]NNM30462.1 redoxin domain-containing protein [Akkermansiaceae bacterium]